MANCHVPEYGDQDAAGAALNHPASKRRRTQQRHAPNRGDAACRLPARGLPRRVMPGVRHLLSGNEITGATPISIEPYRTRSLNAEKMMTTASMKQSGEAVTRGQATASPG